MKDFANEFSILEIGHGQGLSEPMVMHYADEQGELRLCNISKEMMWHIYDKLGIGAQLSRQLYKTSPDIWNMLIEKLYKDNDVDFSDESQIIFHKGMIASLDDQTDPEEFMNNIHRFFEKFDEYTCMSNMNDFGTLRVYLTKKDFSSTEDHIPFVLVSMDFGKSMYVCHQGCMYDKKYIVFPDASFQSSSFVDMITVLNIDYEYKVAEKLSGTKDFSKMNFDIQLSVREVLDILHSIKIRMNLDEEGFATDVNFMDAGNSEIITGFLNSFKIPYKPLSKMKFLRKSLRFNHLTIGDMLKIISAEALTPEFNINGYTLANLCNPCFNSDFDKMIVASEIK